MIIFMDRDAIENTVMVVMSAVLKTTFRNNSEVNRKNTPSWDSLKHMEIFFALEDELGVEFSDDELASLDSVIKIVKSVEDKYAS